VVKQEAFEESMRLKNQFRALDEDEVEFLDSVLESTRTKEAAVKKETAEQLAEFHRQREEAERALLEDTTSGEKIALAGGASGSTVEEDQWAISGRKRKRSKKDLLFSTKIRRSSTMEEATSPSERKVSPDNLKTSTESGKPTGTSSASPPSKTRLDLPAADTSVSEQDEKKSPNISQELKQPRDKKETGPKAAPRPSLGLVAYSSDEE
jgi:hypothetical protein